MLRANFHGVEICLIKSDLTMASSKDEAPSKAKRAKKEKPEPVTERQSLPRIEIPAGAASIKLMSWNVDGKISNRIS